MLRRKDEIKLLILIKLTCGGWSRLNEVGKYNETETGLQTAGLGVLQRIRQTISHCFTHETDCQVWWRSVQAFEGSFQHSTKKFNDSLMAPKSFQSSQPDEQQTWQPRFDINSN